MTRTQWMTKFAVAALVLPVAAAYAEKKPTIVLVHRTTADSADWSKVAMALADQGYHVVSSGVTEGESVAETEATVLKYVDQLGDSRMILVATDAGSETITGVANTEPEKVKGLLFLSTTASTTETPGVPVSAGETPRYFVHLTTDKKAENDKAAVSFVVKAKGTPMVADADALALIIETVAQKNVPVLTASNSTTRKSVSGIAASTHSAAKVTALK